MNKRVIMFIGGFLIVLGILQIINYFTSINLWAIFFSIGLILLGFWIIFRPVSIIPTEGYNFRPFGDINRYGEWRVNQETILMFVGDVKFDLSRALIDPGVTSIRIISFVADLDILLSSDVNINFSSLAFLTESKIQSKKRDTFVSPFTYQSEGYEEAENKINLESYSFVLELDIDQV